MVPTPLKALGATMCSCGDVNRMHRFSRVGFLLTFRLQAGEPLGSSPHHEQSPPLLEGVAGGLRPGCPPKIVGPGRRGRSCSNIVELTMNGLTMKPDTD